MDNGKIVVADDIPQDSKIAIDIIDTTDPRKVKLRGSLTKRSRIIEIGASHAPIVAKSEGWTTTIVDHAPREELIKKYSAETHLINRVEEVDYIWRDGDIADVFPQQLHGTYNAIIASHVGEHMPDLIRFFQAADKLLATGGFMSLALPDKRFCFDLFQPHTTTGDLLAAYAQKRTRHERKTFFNQAAYMVHDGDLGGWAIGSKPKLRLLHTLEGAVSAFNDAPIGVDSEYKDSHTWYFTPASFELLIVELRYLGLIPWLVSIERAPGVEFYALLRRGNLAQDVDINAVRLELLKRIILEKQEEIDLISSEIFRDKIEEIPAKISPENKGENLTEKPAEISVRNLTVSAIIPIYNGSRHIRDAIESVIAQSLPVKELILVDDGSTDNSVELIEQIKAENSDRNIHIFSKDNGGQSSARNYGVARSSGDLIALLDQDDIWYPNHIEELIKPYYESTGPQIGWVYSNLDEVNESGSMVTRSFLTAIGTTHPKTDIFTCIREDLFILPSATLISRKAFDQVGGFDERLSGYEDDDLFLRIFQASYHNIYLNQPLSKWRIHTESASYSYRMAKSRAIYMRKLFEMFPDDVKRSRYYRRDLLAPRFKPALILEYMNAIRSGDHNAIEFAAEQLKFLINHGGRRHGRALRLLIAAARYPKLITFAYSIRRPFRNFMLKRLR